MDEQPLCEIDRLLANMEKVGASDLHLKVGSTPIYRVNGTAQRLKGDPLSNDKVTKMISDVLDENKQKALEETGSVDFARGIKGYGRYRVNVFRQRGSISFCARRVNTEIPSTDNLMLPKSVNRVAGFEDGLVLVVGMTGSGKSTTMASILNRVNATRRVHILTIEDPIEYVYKDDKAFINQREIGIDTPDFNIALKYALRQDPDVILVGEMRDEDTVETALAAAETGHLVLGTLHATNSMQTISRLLEFFEPARQMGIRQLISYTLKTVVGQRLLPGCKAERPRVPAIEVMFVNAVIRKLISEGRDDEIPEAIRAHAQEGMQDFNMSLYRLVKEGWVTEEVGLARSPNPEQLQMQLRGMVLNADKKTL